MLGPIGVFFVQNGECVYSRDTPKLGFVGLEQMGGIYQIVSDTLLEFLKIAMSWFLLSKFKTNHNVMHSKLSKVNVPNWLLILSDTYI